MTPLDYVYFNGPTPVHGHLARELKRDHAMMGSDGTLGPTWELHLHAEWQCVVIEDGTEAALVPLHHVRSMGLCKPRPDPLELGGAVSPPPENGVRKGRPRTKRLDLVRE